MVLRGCTQKLLRWPILAVVFLVLGLEFSFYMAVRCAVNLFELWSRVRFRAVKRRMREAEDFVSWCQAARELDRLEGRDEWKARNECPYYDWQLVQDHMRNLQRLRRDGDLQGLMALLKLVLSTNGVGGINHHNLYNQTHFGTKLLINDFIQTVLECTITVRDAEQLTLNARREFFKRARRWYGRTALMLSGGAALGYYHTGVLKTLLEAKCLPQILSGASAGSLMCSFVSVRTDQEVLRDLCVPEAERFFRACEEPFCVKFTRWLKYGYAFDKDKWIDQMRTNITRGDTTFLEAYKLTGRIINISVTGTSKYSPSVILNYRTSPDVVIWSAVLASSAFPNFLAPIELQLKNPRTQQLEPFHVHGKTFFDGTIKHDIPIKEMSKLWGCNYFIVSQVNPHLIPLFFAQRGGTGRPAPSLASTPSSGLRGGFMLAMFERLLKLDMGKWFKFLSDLDLMPTVFGADWRFIWLQKLTGTVTIVPDAPLWAYFRIISDPNYSRMQHYLLTGERATWFKLCRISNHYRVEKTLIECSRFLEREAQRAGLPALTEKVSHLNAGVAAQLHVRGSKPRASPSAPPAIEGDMEPSGAGSEGDVAVGNGSGGSGSGNGRASGASAGSAGRRSRERGKPQVHAHFTSQESSEEQQAAAARSRSNSRAASRSNSQTKARRSSSRTDATDATVAASATTGTVSDSGASEQLEDVEDIMVARDLSGGEIETSMTAALLNANQPHLPMPLWKRGMETDTDNTDEEYDEDAAQRERGEGEGEEPVADDYLDDQ